MSRPRRQLTASAQALIKRFHASHYMKGLHEVVHRDEQAQEFTERSYPIPLCAPIKCEINALLHVNLLYSDSYVKSFVAPGYETGHLIYR